MTKPRRFAETAPRSAKSSRECRWPIGDPGEIGFRFCCKQTATGRVYCAEHAEKAFAKPKRTAIVRTGRPR
jgi:hypothetical protein